VAALKKQLRIQPLPRILTRPPPKASGSRLEAQGTLTLMTCRSKSTCSSLTMKHSCSPPRLNLHRLERKRLSRRQTDKLKKKRRKFRAIKMIKVCQCQLRSSWLSSGVFLPISKQKSLKGRTTRCTTVATSSSAQTSDKLAIRNISTTTKDTILFKRANIFYSATKYCEFSEKALSLRSSPA